MAVELVVRAIHTKTPTGEKVSANSTWSVLICLCEHANKDTLLCWPSHKRLKFTTQLGGDAVNRALKCLIKNDFITKQRTQTANRYLINESKLQVLTSGIPDIDSQDPEYRLSESGVLIVRDEPVIKPVKNPVKKPVKSKPKKKTISAHVIPDDFSLTQEMRDWFIEKQIDLNIEEETEEFIEFWQSEQGKKKNWLLTWKSRMREQKKRFGGNARRKSKMPQPEGFESKDYGESDNIRF
jgi:hypothetical protein